MLRVNNSEYMVFLHMLNDLSKRSTCVRKNIICDPYLFRTLRLERNDSIMSQASLPDTKTPCKRWLARGFACLHILRKTINNAPNGQEYSLLTTPLTTQNPASNRQWGGAKKQSGEKTHRSALVKCP